MLKQPTAHVPVPVVWIVGSLALATRLALFPYVSEDATDFLLPWMQEFREHGASALGGEFSNYNFPYLLLMFLGGFLPLEPLDAIKTISVLGDGLLALSVGAVIAQYRPAGVSPGFAALVTLFLPTVLLNASMWGQCDSIYTAFLMFSLKGLLRNDGRSSWTWWGVALSFKLQAVFFLPALVFVAMRNRHSPMWPAIAGGVFASLSLPPMLFGRTLGSSLSIYVNQTQDDRLVWGAANIYTWIPSVTADQGRIPAIMLCGAVLLMTGWAYWRGKDTAERRAVLAITALAVCPLLLPQMHDRYFFAAEVMSVLLLRHHKLFLVPWLFALTGLFVYALYFGGNQSALPLMLASIIQCVAVGTLIHFWHTYQTSEGPSAPATR